ncbi:MAG: sigma-70 family RNA polymerase sigma factor, partial [Candidatus Eisenbacteria bacterium]|nr:sigma-70 family RNA polymerase sigma factor [Candidatus Eisenbacteria bacterium]
RRFRKVFGLNLYPGLSLQSKAPVPRIAAGTLAFGRNLLNDRYLAAYPVGQRNVLAELSDDELVRAGRKHDHEAFAELVNRYKHRVYWLVRRMLGSEEDEDVAQEVFLRAYEALPAFRGDCKFSTWIYKITRNLCLAELKKRGVRGEPLSLQAESDEKIHRLLAASERDPAEGVERLDLSRSVRQLMERLPVQYRTVLTLFYLNQATYEEIAEIMDAPLGTVKTNIHRARLQLRELVLADAGLAGAEYASGSGGTAADGLGARGRGRATDEGGAFDAEP